jgi:hypothetical protein
VHRALGRHVAQARDGEVEHLDHALARQEQVRGVDVAVDDLLGVRRRGHVGGRDRIARGSNG